MVQAEALFSLKLSSVWKGQVRLLSRWSNVLKPTTNPTWHLIFGDKTTTKTRRTRRNRWNWLNTPTSFHVWTSSTRRQGTNANLYKQLDNQEQRHVTQIIHRHKPQPAPSNPKQANMVRGSMQLTSTNRAMKSEPNGSDKEIVCVCVPDRKQDFLPICLNAWESLLCITMSLPQDCFLLDVLSDLSNTLHPIRIYMTCQAQYCSGSISPGFWPKLMNINLHPFR